MPRNKAWTVAEQGDLAKAYLKASEDSIVGKDQKSEQLWAKVHTLFAAYRTSAIGTSFDPSLRSVKGLKNQSSRLSRELTLFGKHRHCCHICNKYHTITWLEQELYSKE